MRNCKTPAKSSGDSGRDRHQRAGVLASLAFGDEALIVLAISQGLLTPCFSDEILREYEGVLSREKFSFPRDEVDALIRLLREEGEIVVPGSKLAGLPDPDDEKFVGVRPCCRCRFSRDREPASFPANRCGVAIVNAAGLLDRMTLDWS